MERKYAEFAATKACELLAIDSPSGYTQKAAMWVKEAFESLGFAAKITTKGGVLADLGGADKDDALFLQAHTDTLGAMVAEIKANEMVLSADAAAIRGCLDAVNGRYKQVILMRYVRGYSWAKTGVRMNAPDSTVRNWHERAMERFGEALEELPEAAELAARAARART